MKRLILLIASVGMAFSTVLTASGLERDNLTGNGVERDILTGSGVEQDTLTAEVANDKTQQKVERKRSRQEKREQMRKEEELLKAEAYAKALAALNNREFVLEIDKINFPGFPSIFCSPSTNFISMNGEEAVIQIAMDNHNPRQNGIGGLTLQGRVTELTSSKTEDGNILCSYYVQGVGISAKIDITLVEGDSYVSAKLNPTYRGKTTILSGQLVPIEESSVYKGQPL